MNDATSFSIRVVPLVCPEFGGARRGYSSKNMLYCMNELATEHSASEESP